MRFTLIVSVDALPSPGFIIIPTAQDMPELQARPMVPTKDGEAYYVDDINNFMERNGLCAAKVYYVPK